MYKTNERFNMKQVNSKVGNYLVAEQECIKFKIISRKKPYLGMQFDVPSNPEN